VGKSTVPARRVILDPYFWQRQFDDETRLAPMR
jgi:hypothetical protein